MTWQTEVASWVLPLLADYAIPDDASVVTGVEFGTLDDATGEQTLQDEDLQADYPGLVPDYSLDPEITPTTEGTQYNLKAKKAVGFYGIDCDVISYNDKRLNKWTFPLLRRNFGYAALSRYSTVVYDQPIHYGSQFIIAESVQALALNYDDDFSVSNLFNSVDKFCLTKVSVFLYPEVVLRVRFLPIWEVWAVRFQQANNLTCVQKVAQGVPTPVADTSGNYGSVIYEQGTYNFSFPNTDQIWSLACVGEAYDDPVWTKEEFSG